MDPNKLDTQENSDKKLNTVKKILGIIFCIIVLVLSCFIYGNCKETKKSQASMYETEQQQISEMTEYLNGIDESVNTNMEHLAQATVMQAATDGTLQEITNTLSGMEEQITEVEKVLTDTVVENMDSSTALLKESLTDTKTRISKQIETVNKEISTILADMNEENNSNFQQTYVKIENLQSQLEEVEKGMDNYYKDLTALIKKFQKDNTEEHDEILAALSKAQEGLNEYLENAFESLNLRLDEDMENLMEELNALHNQIITTQEELTNILNVMEENDAERQQEVRDMFAGTKNYLTYIEETFADAHAKLQDIIIKFREMEEANHTETLNVLQVMESDMQETTENGFQNLTETMNSFETSLNSTLDTMQENIFSSFLNTNNKMESNFQSMNENIDNKFQSANEKLENNFQATSETLNQNFQDVKDSMTQNFADLNTNITTKNDEMVQNINHNVDEKVANLTTTINNYNESNGDNLEELKSYLNEQLTQVFTSVSNGKSSLASALLTIGTDLGKKDATFEEICEGIIHSQDVDSSIAATADNISEGRGAWVNGELIIGNGNDVNAAYSQGYIDGVHYTTQNANISYVYHKHSGSQSGAGSGCYRGHHEHTDSCGAWQPYTNVVWWENRDDYIWWRFGCNYCGNEIGGQTHFSEDVKPYYETYHICEARCNKAYNTYRLVCGKTEGVTIESATITF